MSSEGNQKNISSCFREIYEFKFKKSKKNQPPILAKSFEKFSFFFYFWSDVLTRARTSISDATNLNIRKKKRT